MATWYRPNSTAGKITSPYGKRGPIPGAPNASTYHLGVDLRAGTLGVSAAIYAASAGTVRRIYKTPLGAWVLEINHGNSIWTRYAHMQRNGIFVSVGQAVGGGQHVANASNSGAPTIHLHFEVLVDGAQVDPVPFMRARGIDLNVTSVTNPGGGTGNPNIPNPGGTKPPSLEEQDMPLSNEDLVKILQASFDVVGSDGTARNVSIKDALSAVYFYGDVINSALKETPDAVWAKQLTHPLTGKTTSAGDFLRYEPAEHENTRKVLTEAINKAVSEIPGVDPGAVERSVDAALAELRVSRTSA